MPILKQKRIYLDYAASAPELSEVTRMTRKVGGSFFANPSSLHKDGVASAKALADARKKIADTLTMHADEIIFLGSGTESDNLAILGVVRATLNANKTPHVITTVIEHPAVLEACRALEIEGVSVTYLPVSSDGLVDPKNVRDALREETVLVSIAYANNEIGTIQPIKEIAKMLRHFRKSKSSSVYSLPTTHYPLLHTDACQAAAYLDCCPDRLGVDLLTLNGTKLGGPRGTGILFVRRNTPLSPVVFGGGQEAGFRSGTENVVGAVGLAIAFESAQKIREKESARLMTLRDFFIDSLIKQFPNARINGDLKNRLPNNVHVSFPNISSELLVIELDALGISASAGSACSSTKDAGSHVLKALYGSDDEKKYGSVRFSLGRATNKKDILTTLRALEAIEKKYSPWEKQ